MNWYFRNTLNWTQINWNPPRCESVKDHSNRFSAHPHYSFGKHHLRTDWTHYQVCLYNYEISNLRPMADWYQVHSWTTLRRAWCLSFRAPHKSPTTKYCSGSEPFGSGGFFSIKPLKVMLLWPTWAMKPPRSNSDSQDDAFPKHHWESLGRLGYLNSCSLHNHRQQSKPSPLKPKVTKWLPCCSPERTPLEKIPPSTGSLWVSTHQL